MALMGVVMVIVATMFVQALAQPNCAPIIASLAPCLGFITGNSSTPSQTCCMQLGGVVQTQSQCLCTFISGVPQLPFAVNQTQALALPGACKIKAPPLSQCNGGSPQGTPAPSSSTTPSAATAPSPSKSSVPTPTTPSVPTVPSGSKTVPKTGTASSARSSTKFAPSVLFLLFLASALSSF